MAYSQEVVDRFESVLSNPQKHAVGRFDPNDPNVATGMTGAPSCGDVMKLQLKLDNDIITDVKFKTYGCGSAIASSTMFVDMLISVTTPDLISLDQDLFTVTLSPILIITKRLPSHIFEVFFYLTHVIETDKVPSNISTLTK